MSVSVGELFEISPHPVPNSFPLLFCKSNGSLYDLNSRVYIKFLKNMKVSTFVAQLQGEYERKGKGFTLNGTGGLRILDWNQIVHGYSSPEYFEYKPESLDSFHDNQLITLSAKQKLKDRISFGCVLVIRGANNIPHYYQHNQREKRPPFVPVEEAPEIEMVISRVVTSRKGGGSSKERSQQPNGPHILGSLSEAFKSEMLTLEQSLDEGAGGAVLVDTTIKKSMTSYNVKKEAPRENERFPEAHSLIEYDEIRKKKDAVFPIFRGIAFVGTCFAISKTHFMTCCHVLGVQGDRSSLLQFKKNLSVRFPGNRLVNIGPEYLKFPEIQDQEFFPKGIDIAIFSVPTEAQPLSLALPLNPPSLEQPDWWFYKDQDSHTQQRVYVLGCHHSTQDVQVVDGGVFTQFNWQVYYTCRTKKGFSGGPVLNHRGDLVGIHRAGGPPTGSDGSSIICNAATRIDLFVAYKFARLFEPDRDPSPPKAKLVSNDQLRGEILGSMPDL